MPQQKWDRRSFLKAAVAAGTLLPNAAASTATAADDDIAVSEVMPIFGVRFVDKVPEPDADYKACQRLLQNSARYNLGWIEKTFRRDDARRMYIVPGRDENNIRPPSSAAFGIATLLRTKGYDPILVGLPEAEARRRVAMLVKGVAATHKAVSGDPKGWGDQWQSALWAALLGQAGWLILDDLDHEGQHLVARVIAHEADRFIAPDYRVPYWIAPDGKVNFPGDTKAEENAWNACILHLALATLPRHPHAAAWKQVANELMVSAFALKADMEKNKALLDDKPICQWLHGYNVRDDGAVINHNRLHPDYMATPTLNLRTYLVQPLAGQAPFLAGRFNAEVPYRCYVTHSWPSPPNKSPGGTIYQPGKPEVYYPTGTDWSTQRFDIYYLYDLFADRLHLDRGLAHPARDWMRLRAAKLAAMQARHDDGHLYAAGEFDTYPGREQLAIWQFGDAMLLLWLEAHKALKEPK